MICDGNHRLFTCGNSSDCDNKTRTFIMSGGDEFVLRPTQVAGLQLGSGALALSPTTNLTINTTANSVTANSSSSGPTFTAGQMTTVGAGVGVPLLLALLGAGLVIGRQNKRIRSMTAAPLSAPLTVIQGHKDHGAQSQPIPYGAYSQGPQQAAAPYYRPVQPYENLQEPVRAMGDSSQRLEMDAGREI